MITDTAGLIREITARTARSPRSSALLSALLGAYQSFAPLTERLVRVAATAPRYRRLTEFTLNLCDWLCRTGRFSAGGSDEPLFPGLAREAFYESEEIPWIGDVERAADVVRRELLALRGKEAFRVYQQPHGAELPVHGQWNTFNFYHSGHTFEDNCQRCPETTKLLASVPGCFPAPGIAKFSALAPGTHITAHQGFGNFKLRCHLALTDSRGCEMRVADEVRGWEDGKCLVFDDSLEHEVWNRGSLTRVVLLFDFWHPELDLYELELLQDIIAFFHQLRFFDEWKASQTTMLPARGEDHWWV
ncbi:aspartyl/asparaginyl beta-hydroxylase domain-containing protein [Sorangium sp. So ce887]|uniref:aspartyl/asparaginyl beta-hydroxylase domain-containing protein n=1 Tax=Sorangium sp. So ce887 TaxID=3133324 RepID=UPI003F644C10